MSDVEDAQYWRDYFQRMDEKAFALYLIRKLRKLRLRLRRGDRVHVEGVLDDVITALNARLGKKAKPDPPTPPIHSLLGIDPDFTGNIMK